MRQPQPRNISYPKTLRVPGIFNPHAHPRNPDEDGDGRSELLMPLFARAYEEVVGIGNTIVPITTSALARRMKARWQSLVPVHSRMRVHVAGLLTERTSPEDIIRGYDRPDGEEVWLVMKMFVRAASNSGGADVEDMRAIIPCLKAMTHTRFSYKTKPMHLMIHAERKQDLFGRRIGILGRERASIERDIPFLLKEVPEAELTICHVSDWWTIDLIRYLRSCGYKVFGEIAPHYSQYCLDDLFENGSGGTGLDIHKFCVPPFKTEESRARVDEAMVSGEECFHFGSDEACWANDPSRDKMVKVNKRGIVLGGQTQIAEAVISYVAERFIEEGKGEKEMGDYLSRNGRAHLGLPQSETLVELRREDWTVPEEISRPSPHFGTLTARVAMGGQVRKYRVVRSEPASV